MKSLLLLTLLLFITACVTTPPSSSRPAAAATPATSPAPKASFDIYLLMGQSNMVGRDTRSLDSQIDNPHVLALNGDGQWVVAREPMHVAGTGIGPGIPFALQMLKTDPTKTIGLVPCAVGGTPLSRWVKGADLYEKALARAKLAAPYGTIKGVLWHQGETDTSKKDTADSYQSRLTQMFRDFREDLGMPLLPIAVGQLGEFLTTEKYPYVDTVRAALKQMPNASPFVAYVDSTGLTDKGDQLHFDAQSAATFGARYAAAMQLLLKPIAPAAIINIWPPNKMPGSAATQPEGQQPTRGDNATRIINISQPTLSLFPIANKSAPTLIVCPGGGYSYVVYDKEGTEVAAWLNAHGYGAAVLKYRVPNNRPGALQDLQRAISLARANADAWHIDPKRLGVMGFSAGGHMAAKASNLFDQRTYPALDAADQQSCRPDFALLVYPAYLETNGSISPDLNLKANIPPTLIVQTEDDKSFVAGGKLYHAALDEAKIPNQFLLYPTGGHGYALRSPESVRAWPNAALEWLTKTVMK